MSKFPYEIFVIESDYVVISVKSQRNDLSTQLDLSIGDNLHIQMRTIQVDKYDKLNLIDIINKSNGKFIKDITINVFGTIISGVELEIIK